MRYGLIEGGVVVQVAPRASPAGDWVAIPGDVTNGCRRLAEGWTAPPSQYHSWNGTAWEITPAARAALEAATEAAAVSQADQVIGRALLQLLWDQEQRLRALGSDSALAPVRGAAAATDYRAAVVDYIKGQLAS